MGLPLFVAPVESDISSKPVAKGPTDPSHGRSPIRRPPRSPYHRSERHRQLTETREHRLRLLAALQDHDDSPPPLIPGRSRSGAAERGSSSARPEEELLGGVRIFGERRRAERRDDAHPDRPQLPLVPESSRFESRSRPSYIGWSADLFTSDSPPEGSSADTWGYLGGMALPSYLNSRLDPPPGYNVSVGRRSSPLARDSETFRIRVPPQRLTEPEQRDPSRYVRLRTRVRYVDGLGDRDRSLSPEGDGVWDTLQSTLTPDPQPPSVGSSFASTNASAAGSQGTSARSSANTSVTGPDGEVEPPCDPVFDEGPDSEDDRADDTEEQRTEPSPRPTPHGQRSYADVAADLGFEPATQDDGSDRSEWLSGMHRIVRGLASRQDIPDEWWAEAGLSRSMRYEDSN